MKQQKDLNFFKSIDDEITSYLLGYIAADGGIERNGIKSYMLRMVQKETYPLDLMKRFISPDAKISVIHKGAVNEAYRITICSKEICQDLIDLGIIPRKTYSPMNIPKGCINMDYIRGYFDGDGTITYCNNKGRTQVTCRIVSYDANILHAMGKVLKAYGVMLSVREYRGYYYLNIFKQSVSLLYELFYGKSEYYLKRKKDKFDTYMLIPR